MAFTPTNQLVPDQTISLQDRAHAARLFADDQFRLAPKWNFSFHVAFNINPAACKNTSLLQTYGQEINMLVKSIDLPKFNVSVDTVNQYNRHKVVQTRHKFNDINVKFHDDNMSLINQIWQNYYSYYYADSISAAQTGAYNRNATRSSDFIKTAFGLDNGSSTPFFNYIKIYQMARHEWISYTLINPVIKSWDHQNVAYSKNDVHEFAMALSFEAVTYDMGSVNDGTVEGFGQSHYDQTRSPLQGGGSGTTASPSLVAQQFNSTSAISTLTNIVNTVNGYQNTQPLNNTTIANLTTSTTNPAAISGLQGITFPINTRTTNTTVATQVQL
jgi:hypothetical protein